MPDAREYPSVLAEAESAAKAGDYWRAEALLREGLPRQEATLGSAHPEVASTLNNLAVLCESDGRLDEAEQLFRRAYEVALAASHRPGAEAILVTSLENLRDFCAEHGRPLAGSGATVAASPAGAPPPATPATPATPRPAPPDATSAPPPTTAGPSGRGPTPSVPPSAAGRPDAPPRATRAPSLPPAPRRPPVTPRPPFARRAAMAGALLVVVLLAGWGWRWSRPDDATSTRLAPATASPDRDTSTAPPLVTPPVQVMPEPAPASTTGSTELARDASPEAAAAPPAAAAPTAATPPPPAADPPALGVERAPGTDAAGTEVLAASLCASLDTRTAGWTCTALAAPAAPGPVTFLTRVASPVALRLQHVWSQDGHVVRTVNMAVPASPRDGYRTYSRLTVSPGAWTVTLRDADGTVLREVRLDVADR